MCMCVCVFVCLIKYLSMCVCMCVLCACVYAMGDQKVSNPLELELHAVVNHSVSAGN